MSRKEVLVTGATGIVGTGLLRELSRRPYAATVLIRNKKDASRFRRRGLRVILGDITKADSLAHLRSHFDIVFHLAAAKRMFEKNHELEHNNINGLKNVLEVFCSSGKETLFVFASSIDARVRNSDYARTKLMGEKIVKSFVQKHPWTKFINVRIGNVNFSNLDGHQGWRGSLLYHELGNKNLYPVKLERLSKKMVDLIQKAKLFGKTIEIFDRKVRVADLIKKPPTKQKFGHLILSIWSFFGKLTKRADLLVYLQSEK